LGDAALDSNVSGGSNVAIGANALTANTASYNTAVGFHAGLSVTTGIRNTIIGGLAGDTITTSNDNTLIGYQAGGSSDDGANNVAVGSDALAGGNFGNNNVALGKAALYTNAGTSNVAIGVDAGYYVTSGGYNIFLGYQAGAEATNTITGGDGVYIGAFSHATTTNAVGPVVIGYNVAGAEGYTTLGNATNDIRAAHGSITWATVSDERYKKDIVDSTVGLSFINDLTPRTFKYKTLGELPETFRAYEEGSTEVFKNSDTNHGFIAQEIKAAIDLHPEIKDGFKLWDERDDGGQEVAEAALIPVLVKALQELSAKNDALEARIATLEG
jgi:trimeric autotransporter adhesin